MDAIKRKFIEVVKGLEGDWYRDPNQIALEAWLELEPIIERYVEDALDNERWNRTVGDE